jgi:O-antigen ligase
MIFLESILSWISFALVSLVILLSPWFFGAWEVWWFWPFVVCIFSSAMILGLRLAITAFGSSSPDGNRNTEGEGTYVDATSEADIINMRRKVLGCAAFMLFLGYAFWRFMVTGVVMDAQRSFLLFLTPFLIGLTIVFGFGTRQIRLLHVILMFNLLVLGLYAIINHLGWHSRFVLWAPGYSLYINDNRATGTYFCPDHFAGLMEIAFSLSLGFLVAREVRRGRRIFAGILAIVAFAVVVLSKSRGGGLAVAVICMAVLFWGVSQWPRTVRWYLRGSGAALFILLLLAFCFCAKSYMYRFVDGSGREVIRQRSLAQKKEAFVDLIRSSSRGRMIAGALRAWETAPFLGIGPGMHQNLWFHFAPSPDGNRETGKWPSLRNNDFHSYEVHSDWVQLLEEYGVAGILLFLAAASTLFAILLAGIGKERRERMSRNWRSVGEGYHPLLLGSIFSCVALAFHSLGDFNLQIPATTWILSAVVAMAMAMVFRDERI